MTASLRQWRIRWKPTGALCALLSVGFVLFSAVTLGIGECVLALAALSLVGAIALFWASLLALQGNVQLCVEELVSLVMPTQEEERKQSVLRALKDLEYERSVGKISNEDYAALVAAYREEAKQLLFLIDRRDSERLASAKALWHGRLLEEGLARATEEPNAPAAPSGREGQS